MLYQLLSVVGAVMILAAYIAYQRGWMGREQRLYNALNFVGSGLLTVVAVRDGRWGFIALEAIWALLSLPPLIRPPRNARAREGS
ncbi:MAG TPA: hypothetical protein VFK13_08395 [Gemmatimonadaceae bacterium]|nr:hypothetical protein [Gemmatimonadaceae bacterium]